MSRGRKNTFEADTFRISRIEGKSLMVEQKTYVISRETGKPEVLWVLYGYYGKMIHVAEALLRFSLVVPEGTLDTQLKELITETHNAEKRIAEQLERLFTNGE